MKYKRVYLKTRTSLNEVWDEIGWQIRCELANKKQNEGN